MDEKRGKGAGMLALVGFLILLVARPPAASRSGPCRTATEPAAATSWPVGSARVVRPLHDEAAVSWERPALLGGGPGMPASATFPPRRLALPPHRIDAPHRGRAAFAPVHRRC